MNDGEIIALFWERDENAISEADALYGKYLRYISFGILHNDSDADEVVNDVYLKAWNLIPPQKPDPLKAFLGRMTRQLSINRLEKNTAKKRGENEHELVLEELGECIPSPEVDTADGIALKDALNAFLRGLPDESRRIFIRRYWYMQSISEIAGNMRISESKVKSSLMRARNKLRENLCKEGFEV